MPPVWFAAGCEVGWESELAKYLGKYEQKLKRQIISASVVNVVTASDHGYGQVPPMITSFGCWPRKQDLKANSDQIPGAVEQVTWILWSGLHVRFINVVPVLPGAVKCFLGFFFFLLSQHVTNSETASDVVCTSVAYRIKCAVSTALSFLRGLLERVWVVIPRGRDHFSLFLCSFACTSVPIAKQWEAFTSPRYSMKIHIDSQDITRCCHIIHIQIQEGTMKAWRHFTTDLLLKVWEPAWTRSLLCCSYIILIHTQMFKQFNKMGTAGMHMYRFQINLHICAPFAQLLQNILILDAYNSIYPCLIHSQMVYFVLKTVIFS